MFPGNLIPTVFAFLFGCMATESEYDVCLWVVWVYGYHYLKVMQNTSSTNGQMGCE